MNKGRDGLKSNDLLNISDGKVPPHSIDAEVAVLGAIMLEKDAIDTAVSLLRPECFYRPSHQLIFSSMLEMHKSGKQLDQITVVEHLKQSGKLEKAGGAYYVTRLTNFVVSGAHLQDHAEIIYDKYSKRELFNTCIRSAHEAFKDEEAGQELIDKHQSSVNALLLDRGHESHDLGSLLVEEAKRMVELRERSDYITGIPTGFKTLDVTTGGWQDTDLIIIAARPSVGKTAFALNLARNAASHPVKPTAVGFFSMEMSAGQLTRRLISAESDIALQLLNSPKNMTEDQLRDAYTNGIQPIASYPIHIDDTPALTILEARARARKMKKKFGVGLIIFDYLQLMAGDRKSSNREQEISTISRGLKALAKELKIPIIALSQLSRDIEKRKGEPQLSDLRESGAIEQDADMVMFLTRPDYQQALNQVETELMNLGDAWIKKNRHGPLDKLSFNTVLAVQRWMTPGEYDTYQMNKKGFRATYSLDFSRSKNENEEPDPF